MAIIFHSDFGVESENYCISRSGCGGIINSLYAGGNNIKLCDQEGPKILCISTRFICRQSLGKTKMAIFNRRNGGKLKGYSLLKL